MDLLAFQPAAGQARHRQIANHLRRLILSGKLPAGTRLEPSERLVERWKTSYFTVHSALKTLVKGGLLERRPRRGTFVCRTARRIRRVAIYYGANIWSEAFAPYYSHLHMAFQACLAADGIECVTWIDDRPASACTRPFPPLARALLNHEVQGVIVPLCNATSEQHLRQLPIPTVLLTSGNYANRVTTDIRQFVEGTLAELKRLRCRRVGMITGIERAFHNPDGSAYEPGRIHRDFFRQAEQQGLETREEWVQSPDPRSPLHSFRTFAEFGHQAFRRLWSQRKHPDGLIITQDDVAQGVVTAIVGLGIEIPQQLRLVMMRNSREKFFCPFPASWAVLDVQEIARESVRHVTDQFQGKPVGPVHIPYRTERAE